MNEENDLIFIAGFNQIFLGLLDKQEEMKEDLEIDDDEVAGLIQARLIEFYELLQNYYFAQINISEQNHNHDRSLQISDLMRRSLELEEELGEMSSEQFRTFMRLYNPESSFDIIGTINSAKLL
jgi:hypothetical protein